MNKDIWHKADEIPPEDSYVVVKFTSGECEVDFEFVYDFDNIEKWAFFDDLLALETSLGRTKKQLEIYHDFITKLYLNGDITDEQLQRIQQELKQKVVK